MRTAPARPALLAEAARAPRLRRAFYARGPVEVARALLGKRLVRVLDDGSRLSGVIVETEAYLGPRDRASHAYAGRRTPRNESMYARAGTAYVYFTYGMHFCFNVVCGAVDEPVAVLVRALEPIEGIAFMQARRANPRRADPRSPEELCTGPGRLCQALVIDRALNGVDLVVGDRIFIEQGDSPDLVGVSARVGVESAGDWASRPLRWFVRGSPHVSRGPRAAAVRRPRARRPSDSGSPAGFGGSIGAGESSAAGPRGRTRGAHRA